MAGSHKKASVRKAVSSDPDSETMSEDRHSEMKQQLQEMMERMRIIEADLLAERQSAQQARQELEEMRLQQAAVPMSAAPQPHQLQSQPSRTLLEEKAAVSRQNSDVIRDYYGDDGDDGDADDDNDHDTNQANDGVNNSRQMQEPRRIINTQPAESVASQATEGSNRLYKSLKIPKMPVTMEKFTGVNKDENVQSWADQFHTFKIALRWTSAQTIALAGLHLTSVARNWFNHIGCRYETWDAFSRALIKEYGRQYSPHLIRELVSQMTPQ